MDGNSNTGGAVAGQEMVMPTAVASTPEVAALPPEKHKGSIIEIIILVVVSLIAVAGASFAVYYYLEWEDASTNVEGQIDEAVATARADEREKAEEIFAEREKEPNRRFTGPADYGSLSFMFPKTWSVYVANDASQPGSDFEAYLNPGQVNTALNPNTISALRVSILNQSIDTARMQYDGLVVGGQLRQKVFRNDSIIGDRFEGEFNNEIVGIMIMFKINDKTAILRTDAMIFQSDFDRIIETITLNSF